MRKADNLPPYCAVVKKSRSLNFLDPSGPAWPVTAVLYLYLYDKFTVMLSSRPDDISRNAAGTALDYPLMERNI